ncbi:hypothetical protein ACIQD3_16555 [Peribacillus loiseleuriae]|uniref:hypothetical protein n=1 Tax=Peribacillus loiseleuriae TaxID=1679170 RepID=UPI003817869E
MFVTHSFQIRYDKNLYNELRIMQREAASVWNDIVRETTSYYVACKKWLIKRDPHGRETKSKISKRTTKKREKYRRKDGVIGTDLALSMDCSSIGSCSPKFCLYDFLWEFVREMFAKKNPTALAVGLVIL